MRDDRNCPLPSWGPLSPLQYSDAQEGENTTNAYTSWDINLTSTPATSSLPFARLPGFSATEQSFEGTNDLLNIQQPPPDVVDYWFDWFGLSLDPPSSQNVSNSTSLLIQSPPDDGLNDVSLFLVIICCNTPFELAYTLRGVPNLFRIVGLRSRNCQYKSPTGSSGL